MFIESYIYTNLARSKLIRSENFVYHPLQNLIQNKRKLISYLKQNSNLTSESFEGRVVLVTFLNT